MNNSYTIVCCNSYFKIALQSLFENIIVQKDFLKLEKVNILAIYGENAISDYHFLTLEAINSYDLIICTEFFFHAVAKLIPGFFYKFVMIDKDECNFRTNISNALNKMVKKRIHEKKIEASVKFSDKDIVCIENYLLNFEAKKETMTNNNQAKIMSNRKRIIMNKLNCGSNQRFWLILQLLIQLTIFPNLTESCLYRHESVYDKI